MVLKGIISHSGSTRGGMGTSWADNHKSIGYEVKRGPEPFKNSSFIPSGRPNKFVSAVTSGTRTHMVA